MDRLDKYEYSWIWTSSFFVRVQIDKFGFYAQNTPSRSREIPGNPNVRGCLIVMDLSLTSWWQVCVFLESGARMFACDHINTPWVVLSHFGLFFFRIRFCCFSVRCKFPISVIDQCSNVLAFFKIEIFHIVRCCKCIFGKLWNIQMDLSLH